jgi:hypothetical protein
MTQLQPYLGRVLLAAAMATIVGTEGRARARDDDAERDQAVLVVRADQQLEEMRLRVDRQVVLLIGVQGIKPGDLLETLLSRRLKSLASECHLTDAQSHKLRLAGRSDIKHFVDRLDRKETRPPKKFGRFARADTQGFGDFDTALVLCQAATISEAKLKAVFGEDLCDKLTRRLAGRRNAYVEADLKRHGFVLDDGPAAARPARVVTKIKTEIQ